MKTQVFGTFGPACGNEKILGEMINAGLTGMRLNLSHTTLTESEKYIKAYQMAACEKEKEPKILIDMQGPELRVGELQDAIDLQENQIVTLCSKKDYAQYKTQKGSFVPIPHEVIQVLDAEDEVLLDDGKILVQIREKTSKYSGNAWTARVLRGGILKSHKSVKIAGKNIKLPVLTEHDIENIKVAKEYGVTALMQPFVLSGDDLRDVRQVLKENDAEEIKIFAKIENKLGVENIEDILPAADVIVIARGDLGNDMPLWELPAVQKQIEEACQKAGKPYVVVTQMLASMEENPVPTRAEVSDIFHAVYHGAWGVMVTGETAVGKHPIEAIRYLANTSKTAEKK